MPYLGEGTFGPEEEFNKTLIGQGRISDGCKIWMSIAILFTACTRQCSRHHRFLVALPLTSVSFPLSRVVAGYGFVDRLEKRNKTLSRQRASPKEQTAPKLSYDYHNISGTYVYARTVDAFAREDPSPPKQTEP